ncbi:glutathione S-transferase family protein [Planktomarina sp.]|uniref:glutathione S-transferase family protein n=1 Tax=Planktomarina sp. TaxID=2024851 RepID=UPI00288DD631|nr:glutathione S-transferase family protein [Planktomarina sp.]MDT2031820.1 glutathione S-transferase family protein [Planktomarina sp.]
MYTVLGSTKNRTLRVTWTLEELGCPYEQVKGDPGSAEVKAHNPSGKVPALMVDGEVLPDSVAIMSFLSDRHNALTFPAGSVERLRMDGHIHFLLEEFDSLLWVAAKNSFVNPPEHRASEVKSVLKWEFERSLKRLEDRLEGEFLMGERFTISDILAVHCLNWAYTAKFPDATPVLKDYAKRCRVRPAYARALAEI